MGDLKTLPATLDKLGEAESDQTWHYVRMLALEEELSKARAAWMNTLACLEMSWRHERAEWLTAMDRAAEYAAQADELCS